ncbi:unnamed protein product [Amoebophrya sp. A120]|nr:unnamed protein product [Amoebophrya sp. A120]|eukprot:GSA120T00005561001.1
MFTGTKTVSSPSAARAASPQVGVGDPDHAALTLTGHSPVKSSVFSFDQLSVSPEVDQVQVPMLARTTGALDGLSPGVLKAVQRVKDKASKGKNAKQKSTSPAKQRPSPAVDLVSVAEAATARAQAAERIAEVQRGVNKKACTRIAIVGAGPVGLWLALLLCRHYYPKGKEHLLASQIAAGFFRSKKRGKSEGGAGNKDKKGKEEKKSENALDLDSGRDSSPEHARMRDELEKLFRSTVAQIEHQRTDTPGAHSNAISSPLRTTGDLQQNAIQPPLVISQSRPQSRSTQRVTTPARGARRNKEENNKTPEPSESGSTSSPSKVADSPIGAATVADGLFPRGRSINPRRARSMSLTNSKLNFGADQNHLLRIHIYEKRPYKQHGTRSILLALSTQTEGLLLRHLSKSTRGWSPCAPLAELEKTLRQELEKFWWPIVKFHWHTPVDLDMKIFDVVKSRWEDSFFENNQEQKFAGNNEDEENEHTSTGSRALDAIRRKNQRAGSSIEPSNPPGFHINGTTFDAAFVCSGKSAVSHLHKKMNLTKATILSYRKRGAVVPKSLAVVAKQASAEAAAGTSTNGSSSSASSIFATGTGSSATASPSKGTTTGAVVPVEQDLTEFRSIQDRKYNNSLLRNENIIIRELGTYGWVWLLRYEKQIFKRTKDVSGSPNAKGGTGAAGSSSPSHAVTSKNHQAKTSAAGKKSLRKMSAAAADDHADGSSREQQQEIGDTSAGATGGADGNGDGEELDEVAAALGEGDESQPQRKHFQSFAEMASSGFVDTDTGDPLFLAMESSIDYEKAFGITVNVTEANHWGLRLAPRQNNAHVATSGPSPGRGTSPSPKRAGGDHGNSSSSPKRNGSQSPKRGDASSPSNKFQGVLPDIVLTLPRAEKPSSSGGESEEDAKENQTTDNEPQQNTVVCFAGDALCGKPFYLGTTLQFHLHDMNFLVSNVNWQKGAALSPLDFRAYESRMRDTIQGFLTQKSNSVLSTSANGGNSSSPGKSSAADGSPSASGKHGAKGKNDQKSSSSPSGRSSSRTSKNNLLGYEVVAEGEDSAQRVHKLPQVSMLSVAADGSVREEKSADAPASGSSTAFPFDAAKNLAENDSSAVPGAPPQSPVHLSVSAHDHQHVPGAGASSSSALPSVYFNPLSSSTTHSGGLDKVDGSSSSAVSTAARKKNQDDVDSVPDAAEWSGGENQNNGGTSSRSVLVIDGANSNSLMKKVYHGRGSAGGGSSSASSSAAENASTTDTDVPSSSASSASGSSSMTLPLPSRRTPTEASHATEPDNRKSSAVKSGHDRKGAAHADGSDDKGAKLTVANSHAAVGEEMEQRQNFGYAAGQETESTTQVLNSILEARKADQPSRWIGSHAQSPHSPLDLATGSSTPGGTSGTSSRTGNLSRGGPRARKSSIFATDDDKHLRSDADAARQDLQSRGTTRAFAAAQATTAEVTANDSASSPYSSSAIPLSRNRPREAAFALNRSLNSPLYSAFASQLAQLRADKSSPQPEQYSASASPPRKKPGFLQMGDSGDLMKDLMLPSHSPGTSNSASPTKKRIRALADVVTEVQARHKLAEDDPIHKRNEDFLGQFFLKK